MMHMKQEQQISVDRPCRLCVISYAYVTYVHSMFVLNAGPRYLPSLGVGIV